MCLYPKLIKNRKYLMNKKNGGNVPECIDERVKWVAVGCQKCEECRKKKARDWSSRLQEEIYTRNDGKFVTLTFSNESIEELINELAKQNEGVIPEGYELDNRIATLAVRRFLERWRKEHKISVKHWLITELGQPNAKYQGTENLHLHGIIFTDKTQDIAKHWQYGFVFVGKYVNNESITYIVKYLSKEDKAHKYYTPKILCSAGIGSNYMNKIDAQKNIYAGKETNETYKNNNGSKSALPIYYRNKIYSEAERELLWRDKLDKKVRWIKGNKIDISTEEGIIIYEKTLKYYQIKNEAAGYGSDKIDENRRNYENTLREINIEKRITRTSPRVAKRK